MQRYDTVDFTKFFMSLCIVAIHCGAKGWNVIGRLGVPYFFMISSYFFFKSYLRKDSDGQKKMLYKYLKRLCFLFLAWQIIYLPHALISNVVIIEDSDEKFITVINMLVNFLFNGKYDGWGQSWYLFASFYGVLLITVVRKFFPDILLLLFGIIWEVIFIVRIEIYHLQPSDYDFSFLRAIFYLMIGLYLAKQSSILDKIIRKYSSKQISIFLFFIIFVFLFESYLLDMIYELSPTKETSFLTDIAAILLVLWSLSINIQLKNPLIFRELSTFIYTIHILFIRIIYVYFNIKFINFGLNWIEWIVTILLSILCYIGYLYLRKKRILLPWIIHLV